MAHLDGRPSGRMAKPYVVEASAVTRAPPAVASRAITDPQNLPRWFEGAHDVQAKGFPAAGGTLRWTVRWGGSTWEFGGKVVENDLPRRLVVRVATRRSRGLTIHLFEPEGSGTRYTKRVESEGTWLELLAARAFMGRSVRREVKAAARLADELA
jgi:uncharacterized protein YndB with AHSA1/START domain